jgi:hypothetical protein
MISARHMVQETEHMNLAEAEAAADSVRAAVGLRNLR